MNANVANPRAALSPGRVSQVPGAPPLAEIIEAVCLLQPTFRADAPETERNRQVSRAHIEKLHQAGVFRLMQPARYGGYEYGFTALMDVLIDIARGCPSVAWAGALGAIHGWLLSLFPEQAQDDVWLNTPHALTCGSYAPTGTLSVVEGGFTIQGKWSFASNVDNSEWAVLGVLVPADQEGAPPVASFVMVPRTDWRIEDDWHVAGQAGTGSKSILIDAPVFVPAHRRLALSDAASGRAPGTLINRNPIYRIPFLSALPVCLVSPQICNAYGALELFLDTVQGRSTRGGMMGGGNKLGQFAHVQSKAAEAAAAIDAAQLIVDRDTSDIENLVFSGETIDVARRIRNRRGHAYAAKLCAGSVQALFTCVGASGFYTHNPMQRMWRDSSMIAAHITLNWDAVSGMVGQHMFGLEPKGAY